jgi:HPt (histidine-containing phosphotransfer) domain-containing protein
MAFWNRVITKNAASAEDQSIFLQEEFKGEVLINYIRIALVFILEFTTLGKFDVFGHFQVSITLVLTTVMLAFALVYSVVLLFLFRARIYHPFIKYMGVTVNITLVVLSIAIYRLEPPAEYSQISQLARYAIIFIFYLFSILNYSVRLSIYAGIIATGEYFIFVIYGNYFSNLAYTFTGPDGIQYASQFKLSEQLLKLIYILVGAAVAAVVSGRLRNLVRRVVNEQKEKLALEQERQRLIEAVNTENRKYLENVSEGLVLLDRSFLMKNQYSRAFVDIFHDADIAGRNFIDYLFRDGDKQSAERKELQDFLTILFNNETADIDMIFDVNPLKNRGITVKGPDGKPLKKSIQVDFKRVFGQDNKIENLLAIVNDRTRAIETQRELVDERTKREEELDMIQSILKLSPATLADFFTETYAQIHNAEALLSGNPDGDRMNEAFREIHSLRGTAHTLGFRRLSDNAQKVEYVLAQARDDSGAIRPEIPVSFLGQFNTLYDELDKIHGLFDRFKFIVNQNMSRQEENLQGQLDEFLGLMQNMVKDLSKELGKEIVFRYRKTVKVLPFLNRIRNPLIHLVRNAIDHGIEDTYERLAKGKLGFGVIQLAISLSNKTYTIDVQDNGRGISFEEIRKKAVERKLFPADKTDFSHNELVKFIFIPGFSSKDRHTDISGSGVGLDIVKDSVQKLGGKIRVVTRENKGTRFRIVIPENA